MSTQIIPYEEKIWLFEDQAKAIQVTDQPSLTRASALLVAGKDLEKTIKAYFAPLKQNAHTAWKGICDRENLELSRVTPIVDRLNRAAADYRMEQERKRREAEQMAARAAAEKKRLEDEVLRKAQEAERRAREAEVRAKLEANQKTREAAEKEAAQAQAEADAILKKAAEEETKVAPAPIIPEAPKTVGLSMRDNWTFEVVDSSLIPRQYLLADLVAINKVVKAMKDKAVIPGVRIFNKPIMARKA